jgi:hypothetical protein
VDSISTHGENQRFEAVRLACVKELQVEVEKASMQQTVANICDSETIDLRN